jgi:hypothetical protein
VVSEGGFEPPRAMRPLGPQPESDHVAASALYRSVRTVLVNGRVGRTSRTANARRGRHGQRGRRRMAEGPILLGTARTSSVSCAGAGCYGSRLCRRSSTPTPASRLPRRTVAPGPYGLGLRVRSALAPRMVPFGRWGPAAWAELDPGGSGVSDLQRLQTELERIALKLPPDSASFRVARALRCSRCRRPSRIVDVNGTQAEFQCQRCGIAWAVEIPPPLGAALSAGS